MGAQTRDRYRLARRCDQRRARPQTQILRSFIDRHRDAHGVEPICKVLQVAPSGYRRYSAQQRNPALRSARVLRDDELLPQIQRVWQTNMQVYGADKVWRQLKREDVQVARCTVERLMKRLGLEGARRGKVVRTTVLHLERPVSRLCHDNYSSALLIKWERWHCARWLTYKVSY